MEQGNIPRVMQSLDFFILPSESEWISNTTLEVMATALPMIATKAGDNAELVIERKAGQVIPSKDQQALVLSANVQLPDVMRSRGEAWRLRVEQAFCLHPYGREIFQSL